MVAILTTIGIGTLMGEPLGSWSGTGFPALDGVQNPTTVFLVHLLAGAVWHGFCALLAALIMTGLLPFIERLFDVQTDISLLELGDAAHPLLQELARRAPGTYNHSINVASLAEAAAESIGANGLLVRVGAYFHDIGKMFKPGYFVENQGRDVEPPRFPAAGDEHAGDHCARQGRCRLGAAKSPAATDHRLHRAASRHDAGRVLLPAGGQAVGDGSGQGECGRGQLSVPGAPAADARSGRADVGRRCGERQSHAGRSRPRHGSRAWWKTSP